MTSSERQKFEYESESELAEDYKKLVLSSASNLNIATDHLYDSILEEAVMGIAFHMHFQSKHPEVFSPSAQVHEDSKKSSSSHSDYSASSANKFLNCKCLNCEKTVSTNKYASHLENCLGIGRTSSRIASRKKTTNSSYYPEEYPEYDDDPESDANWSAKSKDSKEKTKKKPQGSGNGRSGKNKNKYM